MQTLQPITIAPKDGTPVLLKIKPDQGSFSNLVFVGRNRNDSAEWCFAAPVGCGGIPDSWLKGWMPLPDEFRD